MKTQTKTQTKTKKRTSTKELVLVAMLGAISAVLMLLEFNVPLVLPFIKMDFSELPIILGGFVLGPGAGVGVIVIKILLNFVFNGTVTAGVGEVANFVLSLCYMLPSVLIYQKMRTKKWAALAMVIGTVFASLMSVLMNTYVMFPVYGKAFHLPMDAIVAIGASVNPAVDSLLSLMLFSVLPFNLFKYGVVSLLTFLVYKRLAGFIRNII